ncbi:hypothetical protein F4677DRAFT_465185 [Hypoxylon crocopeplum]|nr:hypothetical protein F4677DRAFT_465185 [Hypoxylon crocopeplum]
MSLSCALCGSPTSTWLGHPHWWRKFCASEFLDAAVYTLNSPFPVYIPLLGYLDVARLSGSVNGNEPWFFIPLDDSITYPSIPPDTPNVRLLITLSNTKYRAGLVPLAMGFPFHTRCWGILSLACFNHRIDLDGRSIQAVFDLCMSLPYHFGHVLDWDHNYEDLLEPAHDAIGPCPGEEPRFKYKQSGFRVWDKRPIGNPKFDRAMAQRPGLLNTLLNTPRTILRGPSKSDPFRKLPLELRQMIYLFMDSRDVANLRLASPSCAGTHLAEPFWQSRFQGGEFEHVFEANNLYEAFGSWRALYHHIRVLTRQRLPCLGNRRRVWRLACHLRSLIELRLSYNACEGAPSHTLNHSRHDSIGWLTAGAVPRSPESEFWRTSKVLEERMITLPTTPREAMVSSVQIGHKTYISGIRFAYGDNQSISLGYCSLGKETVITLHKSLAGFYLAFDSKGIRGLRLAPQVGTLSGWVGDWRNLCYRALVIPTLEDSLVAVKGVKGGFDIYTNYDPIVDLSLLYLVMLERLCCTEFLALEGENNRWPVFSAILKKLAVAQATAPQRSSVTFGNQFI